MTEANGVSFGSCFGSLMPGGFRVVTGKWLQAFSMPAGSKASIDNSPIILPLYRTIFCRGHRGMDAEMTVSELMACRAVARSSEGGLHRVRSGLFRQIVRNISHLHHAEKIRADRQLQTEITQQHQGLAAPKRSREGGLVPGTSRAPSGAHPQLGALASFHRPQNRSRQSALLQERAPPRLEERRAHPRASAYPLRRCASPPRTSSA